MPDQGPTYTPASAPPPPPAPTWVQQAPVTVYQAPPKPRGIFRRAMRGLLSLIFLLSIAFNIYFAIALNALTGGPFQTTVLREGDKNNQVAVYEVAGGIDEQQAALLSAFVRKVKDDGKIKAVVLRVNSPGGGVSASDQMHHEVAALKAAGKKVYVSMGGVAASGGYYISAGAHKIYAEPTTVTGSIGVIAVYPVLAETFKKIGVDMVVIKSDQSDRWKDAISPFTQPSAEGKAYVKAILNKIQAQFTDVVVQGRKAVLQKAEAEELANGKVWIGQEAVDNKLVDSLGYLDEVITACASAAGVSNPEVVQYNRRRGIMEVFSGEGPGLRVDAKLLEEIQTPRLLLLWKVD